MPDAVMETTRRRYVKFSKGLATGPRRFLEHEAVHGARCMQCLRSLHCHDADARADAPCGRSLTARFPYRRKKSKSKSSTTGTVSTPLFVGLIAAAIGVVWYMRRKRDGAGKGSGKKGGSGAGGRSAFKFPDGKAGYGRNGGKVAPPKGKKAKARAKKAEKAEKAEKAAKAKATGEKGQQKTSAGGGDGQQASTSVINYTYFDTARRDTLIPIQKRKALTAKDIMDKDAEARQEAQQPRK